MLLLFTAGPVDINWAADSDKVPVIMQCWIPGQGAGDALLRVLTAPGGQVTSPAGRLPYTWPVDLTQVNLLPLYPCVSVEVGGSFKSLDINQENEIVGSKVFVRLTI